MNLLIAIIRFYGGIYPTCFLAFKSLPVYHTVSKFPDLIRNAAGGANLRASFHLLAIATWSIFAHNLISFVAALLVPLRATYVFLPFDCSICAILVTALVLQIPSMPKLPTECKHASDTLANGYFQALASAHLKSWKPGKDSDGNALTPPSSTSECNPFYDVWNLEIIVLALYLVVVVFEIGISLHVLVRPGYPDHSLNYDLLRVSFTIVTWPFQWVSSSMTHVFGKIICFLSSSTRFAKNYAGRHRRRRPRLYKHHPHGNYTEGCPKTRKEDQPASAYGAGTEFELPGYNAKGGQAVSVCQTCSRQKLQTGLGRLLCLDETMAAIARHLHASDIRQLGQVSRGIRRALYTHTGTYTPSEDTNIGTLDFLPFQKKSLLQLGEFLAHTDRTELLYRGTCKYGDKERCWSCDIPICSLCKHRSRASIADIQHHLDHCTLYCHQCYFHDICLQHRRPLRRPMRCSHSTKLGGSRVMRSLCKACSQLPEKEISIRRERRGKGYLALLAAQAVRCANCQSGLPSAGVRWWVCTTCNLECTDPCHH